MSTERVPRAGNVLGTTRSPDNEARRADRAGTSAHDVSHSEMNPLLRSPSPTEDIFYSSLPADTGKQTDNCFVMRSRSPSDGRSIMIFYPRDAMLARVLAMALCPSVCRRLSVTSRCSIKRDERINLVLAWRLLSTSPILYFKEIRVSAK